jgi:ABC-type amino acid transport substrate-binding protein
LNGIRIWIVLIAGFFLASPAMAESTSKTLTFSYNGYLCPVVCDEKTESQKGFILDIFEKIGAMYGVSIKFRILPKTRLSRSLKESDTDILILPIVPIQKNKFAASTLPVAYYTMGVMRRRNFEFHFSGLESLEKVTWGVVSGERWRGKYQEHIDNNKGNSVMEVYGTSAYDRMIELLARNRVDVVIALYPMLDRIRLNSRFANDVVVDLTNVFGKQVPIHAAFKDTEFGKMWAIRFDKGIRLLFETGQLKEIFSRYGVDKNTGISLSDLSR